MKRLDRVLQRWRIRHAVRWIPDNARVLDVGCFDDTLFKQLDTRLRAGVGMDPQLGQAMEGNRYRLVPGTFPNETPTGTRFDVITMLAVLEHVSAEDLDQWVQSCVELLEPRGLVVATVPAPAVDKILDGLMRVRLLDGMEVDQHHGADPSLIAAAFEAAGFTIVAATRFQFGLNNVFVFRAPDVVPARSD